MALRHGVINVNILFNKTFYLWYEFSVQGISFHFNYEKIMLRKIYLILALCGVSLVFAGQPLSAQQQATPGKVAGKIVDSKTGEAVAGATIQEKGNPSNAVIGSTGGTFTIEVLPGATLTVQSLGYTTQDVPVNNSSELTVRLSPGDDLLNEVVVVGYGTQKVKDLTAPISLVKGSDLTRQLTPNPMSALQGKVAGVQVINSGVPGAGPTVKIRGVGSIGDYGKPLYIVDGVFVDDIDFLNSSDIESMNVLKDASAASIYGVKAANGVVMITTKRGSVGKTSITYDGYVGVQVPVNIMPLTNKDQYIDLVNEANQNKTGYVMKDPGNYPTSTDWYSELTRNAVMHNHSLDVTGATERTNYAMGVNYFYQDGIMNSRNDNSFERLNIRGRFDQDANKWLKVGVSAVVSNYTQYTPGDADINGIFTQALVNPPVYPVYDDNNTAAYPVRFGSPQSFGFSNTYGNPVAKAYYLNNREKGIKTIFSSYAEITLIPDKLKWKTAYNLNYNQSQTQLYQPEYFVGGSQGLTQSQLTKTFISETKNIVDNTLTYNDNIGRHRFSVMLGQSSRSERRSTLTGSAVNVPDYDDQSLYLSNGSYLNRSATDNTPAPYLYRGVSFFGRGTYNYADKYLATVTFRADASSKYQQKWGYFPSVGLGWVMTGENFMQNQHWTDYLKLRASYGAMGNDAVPFNDIQIQGVAGAASSGIFGLQPQIKDGVGAQTVNKAYLKWEVVKEFNIGADARFLKNRLSVEADYYTRTTSRVVFSAPLLNVAGTPTLLGNNGKVRNQGVELTANWDQKVNRNFSYHVGLNATTINNKVLALNGTNSIPGAQVGGGWTTNTQVGYPIGSFWGYQVAGVYASDADYARDPVRQTVGGAGFLRYKDQNGDKVIDDKDKVYLGSPIPKLIGGIDFGATWKRFDFSLNIQGQAGNKMLNAKRMNRSVFPDGNYDLDFFKNAWRPDRMSNTYPSAEAYNNGYTLQANSFFVEDASYIRIQNIQIGYTFGKWRALNNLRIYVSAQRPFTYFTYNGFTPEVGGDPIASGIDNAVYPMQAVYAFGLKANF